jgi:hypothetical protein
MKNGKFLIAVKKYVISISLVLTGCTTTSPAFMPTSEPVASVNAIVVTTAQPTQTPFPATEPPSATLSLTPTPTPTNTLTPTPTIHPTATETPFAIPTPPGTNTHEQVLWLFETNNGCQLPCWWGITPGETEWQTAQEMLNIFDSNIYEASTPSGLKYYGVRIPLPPEVFSADHMELGILVDDGIAERIFTDASFGNTPPGYLTSYTLSTFLTAYGQPSEVKLFTYSSPFEEGDLPFAVALFYAEQGIVALFSDNGERQGDWVQGCPQEDPVSFLGLWAPDLGLTFEQVTKGTSALEREYLPLEEVTEMSVATFYEIFKNPDNTTCLETPASLWR